MTPKIETKIDLMISGEIYTVLKGGALGCRD
jgi:hypothetical protein